MGIPSFRTPTNRIWGLVSLHVLCIFLEGFPSYRMSPWHPPTLRHLIEPTDTVAVEARTRCLLRVHCAFCRKTGSDFSRLDQL